MGGKNFTLLLVRVFQNLTSTKIRVNEVGNRKILDLRPKDSLIEIRGSLNPSGTRYHE